MPHPLQTGKSINYGLGWSKQRPELSVIIGQIANDWNYFESVMESLYALLMGRMYIGIYLPSGTVSAHPIAFQIFEELESFRAKQNLVEALIKWAFQQCPGDFAAYKAATEKPIKVAYFARNRAVHTLWGICDDYPDALISVPTFGRHLVWKKSDFQEESKKISKGLVAFSKATAKLLEFAQGNVATPCSIDALNDLDGR